MRYGFLPSPHFLLAIFLESLVTKILPDSLLDENSPNEVTSKASKWADLNSLFWPHKYPHLFRICYEPSMSASPVHSPREPLKKLIFLYFCQIWNTFMAYRMLRFPGFTLSVGGFLFLQLSFLVCSSQIMVLIRVTSLELC